MGVQENALGDKFTYPFVLKAWARESAIDKGREVHGVVVRVGFIVSLLNLVCEKIESVRQVFDGFTMKDVVLWNTMKMGYARNGMVFEASDGFREMVEMGEASWISKEARMLIERMDSEPNVIVWGSLFNACSIHGDIEGKAIRKAMDNVSICKLHGYSIIGIGDVGHEFLVPDKAHPKSKEIY
ncbi:hypothetical protein ACFX15_027043 [Malus domestica]